MPTTPRTTPIDLLALTLLGACDDASSGTASSGSASSASSAAHRAADFRDPARQIDAQPRLP